MVWEDYYPIENGDGGTYGHGHISEASASCAINLFKIGQRKIESKAGNDETESREGNDEIESKAGNDETESKAGNDEIKGPMIGIDLGTTNSCVAVWHEGHVEIIPNELGHRTTPSVVSFTDYGRLIGEAATNQASKNLVNTIFDAKRLIGRSFSDDIVKQDTKLWPFEVIDGIESGKKDQPMIVVNYMGQEKKFTPEEISAMTIAKMKGIAENFLGTTVNNAVITVPAHFNHSQRQATKDAGAIAGFTNVYLINEPTAAAITYSLDKEINNKKNVLVFHLGGGSFDVSLVEIKKGEIRVKSTCGNSHLGGTDFDNRMVRDFIEEFEKKHNEDISMNPRALARLRVALEKAKRLLSLLPQADVQIDCIVDGIDFRSTITCAHFETLNKDLFEECESEIDKCLHSAKISKSNVDDVILVGGSSRVPTIQNMLKKYSCRKGLCKSIHPEEAVVSGAAIYAAILSGVITSNMMIALKDIKHSSLDVHYSHESTPKSLFDWNTAIPKTVRHEKKIDFGDHPNFMLEVIETEKSVRRQLILSNIVSRFDISCSPQLRGTHKINVYFEIDVNGILKVLVEFNGNQLTTEKWNGRLLEEDINRMIEEAASYKAQDLDRKKLLEAKSNLESNAYTILEELDDAGNVDNEEVENIRKAIAKILESMELISVFSEISEFEEKLSTLKNRVKELHLDDKTIDSLN